MTLVIEAGDALVSVGIEVYRRQEAARRLIRPRLVAQTLQLDLVLGRQIKEALHRIVGVGQSRVAGIPDGRDSR